ncbi:hypothetical protein ETD86_41585 [Nonomuraea turkmeniaca]|uniref:ATPase AAA-type core domain-containing protein n=1 Tax=Nonomuraea turkmeniaca TaxID=103838 RepID=A0A5S4F227_9ACTN|nr:AAA family ATPase [Nonomuraea turkmeniaca]TMR09929.1 hypothetical protein ETD86_41585 [Nonomuraea turkmeniaca]
MSSTPETASPFIFRVRVRGFRSIAECDVRLGPLTVLAGFNAAGKSNFLDVLRFVSDALGTSPGRALAARGGLDRVLCHAPEAGVIAEAFSIDLDLRLSDEEGRPVGATYGLEIGRGKTERAAPVLLKEQCRVELADGATEWFLSTPEKFTGSALIYSGERAAQKNRDRLFLPASVFDTPFRAVETALLGMRFYEFDTETLRGIDDDTERHTVLGPRGEHLGHVLGALAESAPEVKDYVDTSVRAIVPQCLGVDERREGEFSTVQARFWAGDPVLGFWTAAGTPAADEGQPHVQVFRRQELSDGTLRAAGVVVALAQPGVLTGDISLVAIEEPEIAIHPANVGALFGDMHAASTRTQVIVTTQSSDLLDSEEIKPDHLRIVEMHRGVSVIGELDEHTKTYLGSTKPPGPLPDMHRQGQLRPANAPEERP